MGKYIDADRLRAAIEEKYRTEIQPWLSGVSPKSVIYEYVLPLIDYLKQEQTDMGEVSDGYHTFNELYYYRMLYNAAFFNLLPKEWVHKSKRHHTGEECFGGGWFIVMANLPTGQVSNHYELKDWDLFQVPEKEFADEWDGHTPQEAAERLYKYLQQDRPELPKIARAEYYYHKGLYEGFSQGHAGALKILDEFAKRKADPVIVIKQQEQPEVDYNEFEKLFDDFCKRNKGHHITSHDACMWFWELGLNARKKD